MRAILLAAGLGTRLRPITDTIPKCLVLIHGKPLLQIWLEKLTEVGIGPFLINTHYLHKQVEKFIEESEFSEQVELVYEEKLLGTAGTLSKNIDFFQGKDGMFIHADNYCLSDFNIFVQAHKKRPSGCLMTMMTFRSDSPSSCGIVELDENGVVIRFYEKVSSPPGNLANGAVYILSKELIGDFNEKYKYTHDFSLEIIHQLMNKINTHETKELLVDIGTLDHYLQVNL